MNQENFTRHYLEDSLKVFRNYKGLAEKAFAQVSDEEFFRALDAEANSIAVIIRHLAGNMRSRWTNFLTTDGEKPDRHRDSEFEMDAETTREEVMQWWEQGWQCTFAALEPLQPADFDRPLTIRGEPYTVVMAINRQLAHYASHIGQIILLAKHFRSSEWESLSIPRRQSETFNRKMLDGEKS
ncbi:MAG: DUF1572 family protein [Pyrinomonadaceae bacterium]|nr:DUF1572 family protein [Pyrinomonadaceae bacterium]MDQ3584432.1 DUF1572 domain-containing protein [Acidobacteriota bacterium]